MTGRSTTIITELIFRLTRQEPFLACLTHLRQTCTTDLNYKHKHVSAVQLVMFGVIGRPLARALLAPFDTCCVQSQARSCQKETRTK